MSELMESIGTMVTRSHRGIITIEEMELLQKHCGFTFTKHNDKYYVGIEEVEK